MRIPPSVIVMSLLTAVPFAFAIKDAAKSHDKLSAYDDDDDDEYRPHRVRDYDDSSDDYAAQRAEMEKMRAEEREREIKLTSQRRRLARQLVGTEPASLGAFFSGLKLGASAGAFQSDELRAKIADASEVLGVHWDVDASELNGLTVTLKGDENGCSELASAVRTWGSGNRWENAATHQRATFDEYECSISFERFADLEHWVDRTDTAVLPISMVGQPVAKLRARVAAHLDDEAEDSLSWHDIGFSGGKGPTRLTAGIENGKVVSISGELPDNADMLPIIERISKLSGVKGKHNEDEQTTTWKGGKFQAVMYENIPSLVIGKHL